MDNNLKEVLKLAVALTLSRDGDVTTEDGNFATVDTDIIIELDMAISKAFSLDSDCTERAEHKNIIAYINKL
ncbi:hypothetical protein JLT2_66 [Paraglaciecola Antarctic JLT virus 2]|nr:hypothetical protein JLT2_66 [Paraglaciecola Antarctic JLT virus 2]